MTILNLNGYAVEILDESLKRGEVEIGPQAENYKGWMRDASRAWRRTWSGTIPLNTAGKQECIEQLLRRGGVHIPFDVSLYSDRTNLGPQSGYSVTLGTAAPAPKFGARRANISSATTCSWVLNVPPAANTWSMAWWFSTGGAWDHYCVVSTLGSVVVYKNGVVSSAGNYSFSGSGTTGTFSLLGKDAAGVNTASAFFDDLVIFPTAALHTDLITAFAAATSAQSSLPYLNLTGDLLEEAGPVEVRGRVSEARFIQGSKSTWKNNLRVVDFSLVESQPYR